MAQWFFDNDADLSHISGKTIAVFGYGNQGRAQSLNMLDNRLSVIVGSRSDDSARQAEEDGFPVLPLSEAAEKADILFLLIPDEVMPQVYRENIAPFLKAGDVLVFASGYNIYFQHITPPESVDVVLLAPRMIGKGVRDTFLSGDGFPSLIGVHKDATGKALERTLALSKAIGSTKMGVVMSSFEEETIVDLFAEHWGFLYAVQRAYEALRESGCSPEAILLELYASGEGIETARAYRDIGLWHQITLHSRTSQYGQEVTAQLSPEEEKADKARLHRIIENIRSGSFADAWRKEQEKGFPRFDKVRKENLDHPMIQEERKLYRILRRIDE